MIDMNTRAKEAAFQRFSELQEEERGLERTFSGQLGTSIPNVYYATDTFIVNPSNVGTHTLSRMITTDESCLSALQLRVLMITSKIGEYHHENQEIKDFVNGFLSKLEGPTWRESMEAQASSCGFGFSVSEVNWGLDKKLRKVPVQISTYHPSTIAFEADNAGRVTPNGILQFTLQYNQNLNPNSFWTSTPYGTLPKNPFTTPVDRIQPTRLPFIYNYGLVRIPRNKVIHHVNMPMLAFGSPYGASPVRTAHLPWQLKVFFLKTMGIAGKRAATPTVWGTAPLNGNKVKYKDANGVENEMTAIEAMIKLLKDRESDDALVTGPEGQGYKIQAILNEANLDQLLNVINNMDVRIFRSFLFPSLVMTDGSAGNRALGDKHFDIANRVAESDAKKFAETLRNDLVKRAIIENFGEQEDYGEFAMRPQSIEERQRMQQMFTDACNSGILKNWTDGDMSYMRSALSYPKDTDPTSQINPRDEHNPGDQDGRDPNSEDPTKADQDGKTQDEANASGSPAEKPDGSSHEASATEKPQDSALNGAQVTSLVDVVKSVAAGELPRESAIEIIMHAFNMSREQAEKVLGDAGKGFKTKQDEVNDDKSGNKTGEDAE